MIAVQGFDEVWSELGEDDYFWAKSAWLKRDAFMRAGLSKRERESICSEEGAQMDRWIAKLVLSHIPCYGVKEQPCGSTRSVNHLW